MFSVDCLDDFLISSSAPDPHIRPLLAGYRMCVRARFRPPVPHAQERLTPRQTRLIEGIAYLDPGEQRQGRVTRRWRMRDDMGLAALAKDRWQWQAKHRCGAGFVERAGGEGCPCVDRYLAMPATTRARDARDQTTRTCCTSHTLRVAPVTLGYLTHHARREPPPAAAGLARASQPAPVAAECPAGVSRSYESVLR